ncbi:MULTISPECIES: OmpA family protein [unclassified Arcicella]|nr:MULTISPECIES: OmpA family protein [unclassified Arcicella]MDR6814239.1 outer membrane protein OmpA-like peptidoglycan-associated protein/tetratricopeptide (TPR) repeat protein [Arcicella sp. BE140]MDR6825522.1 outer membrane protein OmpA-like peptidoglycan-associated protein/tetratricopeptide (TPR) repeat protein [Arcicella sp. BE139]
MLQLKKSGLSLLFVVMSNFYLTAQHFNTTLNNALRCYDLQEYAKAINGFNQVLKNDFSSLTPKDQLSVLLKLANSYKQNKEEITAEKIYRQAFTDFPTLINSDAKAHINFAQVLAHNGNYQEAQEYFTLSETIQNTKSQTVFSQQNPTAKSLDKPVSIFPNRNTYKIEYLDFNTSAPEFSPIYYKDGIVFCSQKESATKLMNDKGSLLDLYFPKNLNKIQQSEEASTDKKKKKNTSKNAKPLSDDYSSRRTSNDSKTLNYFTEEEESFQEQTYYSDRFGKTIYSKFQEGPATFNKDFTKIILTRNSSVGTAKGLNEDNINKLKLYIAENIGGKWTELIELPFNDNEFSTAHPAWSKDEKTLYFASDRLGGFGGMDIWSVEFQNGKWGSPKNLGKNINSKGADVFPFLDENGNLYFSSNGQGGEGDLDIFFVEKNEEGIFTKPTNLGKPFNSPFDDFGIITDKYRQIGYFTSNRKLGEDGDIYRFSIDNSLTDCRKMNVVVFDAETKMPINNVVVKISSSGHLLETLKTDAEGYISFCTSQDTDYAITIEKESYAINNIGYSTKGEIDDVVSKLEVPLINIKPVKLDLQISPLNNSKLVNNKSKKTSNLKEKSVITGFVRNEIDKKPMEGVLVSFMNACDNTTQQTITGTDGSYTFYINEDCDYTIEISKNGYSKNVNKIKKEKKGNAKIISQDLEIFKEGDLITMNNIYYNSGSATLRADALKELNKLVAVLQKNLTMVIEIGSHTDSRGDTQDNLNLSSRRAQTAVDYIISKGISRSRVLAKGYGESELVNSCANGVSCTEIEHQQNRRTTVKIIKIK